MEINQSLYLALFIAGLGGGFGHCIGMCGPLVAGYSLRLSRKAILPHLMYNIGRIFTYMFLGGLVGYAGSFVSLASRIESLQRGIMIFAGIVIVALGFSMIGIFSALVQKLESLPVAKVVNKTSVFLSRNISEGTLLPFGLIMGFLPCGLVYTSLLLVARATMESPSHPVAFLHGMAYMGVFGLGTLPALILFGRTVGYLNQRFRRYIYSFSAIIIIIMGGIFIFRAIQYH